MLYSTSRAQQRGFTLIELIIVIVITGIIAVGSTQFIVNAVQGLEDVSRRAALANMVSISSEKIERQLRSSVVSSVRVARDASSQCVEMLPIRASAFYLKEKLAKKLKVISLSRDVTGMQALIARATPRELSAALLGVVIDQQAKDEQGVSILTLNQPYRYAATDQQKVHFVTSAVSYCIEGDKLFKYSQYRWRSKQRLAGNMATKEPYKVLVGKGFLASSSFSLDENKLRFDLLLSAGNGYEQLTINQPVSLADE